MPQKDDDLGRHDVVNPMAEEPEKVDDLLEIILDELPE